MHCFKIVPKNSFKLYVQLQKCDGIIRYLKKLIIEFIYSSFYASSQKFRKFYHGGLRLHENAVVVDVAFPVAERFPSALAAFDPCVLPDLGSVKTKKICFHFKN